MKKIVLNIGLLLLALFGAISCNIKEDMSNCPGSIILDYSAYSEVILDDIGAAEQVDIFIFNPEGICVDIYTFTYGELQEVGFEFDVPIQYSNYNAVVWQGLNSENYTSRRMVLGESYENFYMRLVYEEASTSYEDVPDPLWASSFEPIEFCAKITRHRVYMTRLHTEFNVTLQEQMNDGSLVELDILDFALTINACNNVYQTDYDICAEEAIMIEYTDDDEEEALSYITPDDTDGEECCAHVGTLRITPDMDCTLEIDSTCGCDITIGSSNKLDLVEYMLATKDDTALSDQEFLDLNKVWDINLIVQKDSNGYAALSLSINGWVVWFSSNDLS